MQQAHDDLNRILTDFTSNETALREVMGGLSEKQLNWEAGAGKSWSILQCVSHLALSNESYTGGIRSVLRPDAPRGRDPVRPSAPGAIFLKKLEPPVRQKVRAPEKIVPLTSLAKESVLTAFAQTHNQIQNLVQEVAELDLNRLKFRNPLLPLLRVRVGTALLIMAAHERRHLWQAQRVREAVQH
ncbi:MAG: hypothetical protein QOJ99_4383 [Bryobacterales bacterium]|jgi:hypothetical protein|nr:hypothetical protein [Bryobacterales bacterium]